MRSASIWDTGSSELVFEKFEKIKFKTAQKFQKYMGM
jgi:hypothetical protein